MSDGPATREALARAQARFRDAFDWLLKQPKGRLVLHAVIDEMCRTSADPFVPDALLNAYAMGRRSIGVELQVLAQKTDPEMAVRMLNEAVNASRELVAARARDAKENT